MRKKLSVLLPVFMACLTIVTFAWSGVSEAKRAVLENGLEIVFIENHASPIVSSNVIVKAGVSTEPSDMNGVSHFLEHLLFNGTKRRTQKELYDEVDFYGAYNNAFTREDYTAFQMIIASPFLEKGLDIQADMLFSSTIPEDKFEKEKRIVIEEIGKDQGNPDYLAELFFKEKAFQGTPYSRPILGTVQSVSDMKREEVIRYYKQHYVPNNMILFLFGDFETDQALKLIEKYFGEIPSSKIEEKVQPTLLLKRTTNLYRNKMETSRNYLEIVIKAPNLNSEDFFAFYLLISVLSDGEDSRLHRSLKGRAEPLVFRFSLGHSIYGNDGLLHFSASIPETLPPEKAVGAYFKELQKVGEEGITARELEKAQKDFKASEIFLQEQLHYYVAVRGQWLAFAKPGFLKNFLSLIEHQDLNNVNAVARKYLKELVPVITISGPKQEKNAIEEYEVPSYQPEEVPASAEHIKRKILDNGMTVIAKREAASEIFAVHLLMKNRSANEAEGKTGIADFTHRMLTKGTILMDSVELSEAMKEIGARVKSIDSPYIPYDNYYTSSYYSYIRFETLSEHYLKGLKLLKEIAFHPSFPEEEVGKVASEMENLIKKNEEKVSAKSRNMFMSRVFGPSKLGNSVYGDIETISSINKEDLFSFHHKYFSPQNILVTIVSNVPVEEVMKKMEELFGTIKRYEGEVATMPKIPPTRKGERSEFEGGQRQSYIYAGYLFSLDQEDIPALTAANAILSDRMAFQLREKKGFAYRVGSYIRHYGDSGLFFALMGTKQENLENAIDGILDQIDSFSDSDFLEKEVEKTINSLIGRNAMRRISGINRAYFLGLSEFQGRGYGSELNFINRLRAVDVGQIKKVARKYFDTSKIILVIAK